MTFRELILITWGIDNSILDSMIALYNPDIGGQDDFFELQLVEWDKYPRESSMQVERFYEKNIHYSAALVHVGLPLDAEVGVSAFGANEWVSNNVAGRYVLDFGAGFGGKCMSLISTGHNVVFCDIPAPHTQILRKMLSIINLPTARFHDKPFRYKFDTIVTDQVMEHLYDPLHVVCQFHDALFPGGKLLMDYWFENAGGTIAEHLASNNVFGDDDYWNRCVESIGFNRTDRRVWVKI